MSESEKRAGEPLDVTSMVEGLADGWKSAMGITFTRATADEVIAELVIGQVHRQPLGLVHGGVHAGLIETVASVGASISAMEHGRFAVGLENHTSFLRAAREGTLRAVGRPLTRGKRSHVWQVDVTDAEGRAVATGRVRLLLIEQGKPLAGRSAELEGG
jgi:1,4-dihydroxy-2-naphthoyl-CoA hydrolase